MPSQIKTLKIFYHPDNLLAAKWHKKIAKWLSQKHPSVRVVSKNPNAAIVLGGDGTILEAARLYQKAKPIILGLNLGQVGFLASVRKPKKFLSSLAHFLKGDYHAVKRMMVEAIVVRNGKEVFSTNALNDVAVQSTWGLVKIEVNIEECPIQYIRGTGALVSTATGSTAYNLSAHGPIVMPDIKCLILTELFDHNVPTPSVVIKHNRVITLKINDFRKRGVLSIAKTGVPVDIVLIADGEIIFPLEKGDIIKITRSPRLVTFAELEKNYFFKSLQEKFAFK